jgi:hypothetical protein
MQELKTRAEEASWFQENLSNASQEYAMFRFWKGKSKTNIVCSASSYPWQMLQMKQSLIA